MIYANEMDAAQALLTNSAIPLQNKVIEQLTKLYTYQETASEKAIKQTEHTYQDV